MERQMTDRRIQRTKDREQKQTVNALLCGSCLRSEKGIVLVVVLVLSAVALAIMTAMIYMITIGTQTSGLQKRYKTALEAGIGGGGVFSQLIMARGDTSLIGTANLTNFNITTPVGCSGTISSSGTSTTGLAAKLMTPSKSWNTTCNMSTSITPTLATSYDMRMDLGAYRVYAKIVATTDGNTVNYSGLDNSGVADTNTGLVAVTPISYFYAIEVVSENSAKIDERAKLSILYQF
jgi:hypothetical protein